MQEVSFRTHILPLKNKLFRLAFRITLNSGEAEDVVQDTMIRVWKNRDQWPEIESIEAYCLTICRNLALDRSAKKDAQALELPGEDSAPTLGTASNPHDELVREERLQLVHNLLNELPEAQRTVLHLRDIEGRSYKEIATVMHATEEWVKVNLFRARQKIRQQYKEIDEYGL
jgi:RNA polymerase sigma-70 factor (ECF subfamily)